MKSKKIWLIGIILIIIASITGVVIYLFGGVNRLTIIEKQYIEENSSNSQIINVNVINDSYVFGYEGQGVFYEFLNDFKNQYNLNVNNVTHKHNVLLEGVNLGVKTTISDKDTVFYTDHYVLIAKDKLPVTSTSSLVGKTVSLLADDLTYVSSFINENITYISYETIHEVLGSLSLSSDYVIIPLHLYLKEILQCGYPIVYHFSDMNIYYTLTIDDSILGSVMKKYYNNWKKNLEDYYNEELFNIMVESYNITDTEIDEFQTVKHLYGYVNNSPYEVISSGSYGGIVAVYLNGFANLTKTDFQYTKYKNFSKINKAINSGEVDIYFDYYQPSSDEDFHTLTNGISATYYIIANQKNDIVVTNINSLKGKSLYVDKNSKLYNYFSSIEGIDVKTYNGSKGLKKLNNKDVIIAIDTNIYEYFKNHGISNYTVRLQDKMDFIYTFEMSDNKAFYKLFNSYMTIKDPNKIVAQGFYNHGQTVKSGIIFKDIAKGIIGIIFISGIVLLIAVRRKKRVKIATKLKKESAVKYIDQLTLLKNRNFLTENIKQWSNNTIYPQTIIVIDLNNIQQINDTKGYDEGDKQIVAAANALIKTQLENSEIIRSNGNEFIVYLIGYSQKQITNYIHKLNKELAKMPYNYGAEFGYTMILDDITTIEDALNEAIKEVKSQKEKNEGKR